MRWTLTEAGEEETMKRRTFPINKLTLEFSSSKRRRPIDLNPYTSQIASAYSCFHGFKWWLITNAHTYTSPHNKRKQSTKLFFFKTSIHSNLNLISAASSFSSLSRCHWITLIKKCWSTLKCKTLIYGWFSVHRRNINKEKHFAKQLPSWARSDGRPRWRSARSFQPKKNLYKP